MARSKTENTNLASEFYVASQLFRLGYLVTVTLGQAKQIDLIVAHPDGRTVTIDVKGLKNKTNWPLHNLVKRKEHFYVFVGYGNKFGDLQSQPGVFIVPSVAADNLIQHWSGAKKKTKCVTYSRIKNTRYKDAWDLLFR